MTFSKPRTPLPRGKGFKSPTADDIARRRLRRTAMNKVGKQGRANKRANATLAKEFTGERYCEARLPGCWMSGWLSWAHHSKRRKLSPEELTTAALCCVPCHQILERMQAEEMKAAIENITAARSTQLQHVA